MCTKNIPPHTHTHTPFRVDLLLHLFLRAFRRSNAHAYSRYHSKLYIAVNTNAETMLPTENNHEREGTQCKAVSSFVAHRDATKAINGRRRPRNGDLLRSCFSYKSYSFKIINRYMQATCCKNFFYVESESTDLLISTVIPS